MKSGPGRAKARSGSSTATTRSAPIACRRESLCGGRAAEQRSSRTLHLSLIETLRWCVAGPPLRLQDDEQVLGVDRAAGMDEDLLHGAVAGSMQGRLHLHGFDGEKHVGG